MPEPVSAEPTALVQPEWQPPVRLSLTRKLVLAREVLAVYLRVRWLLSRHDLTAALTRLRDTRGAAKPLTETTVSRAGFRLGWAVTRTLRVLPTDGRCLMQALCLTRLLAVRGVDSTLVIGVKPSPSFAAHAWVEVDGQAMLDPGSDYGRLLEY